MFLLWLNQYNSVVIFEFKAIFPEHLLNSFPMFFVYVLGIFETINITTINQKIYLFRILQSFNAIFVFLLKYLFWQVPFNVLKWFLLITTCFKLIGIVAKYVSYVFSDILLTVRYIVKRFIYKCKMYQKDAEICKRKCFPCTKSK